jgi:hypothetical protein
MNLCRTRMIAGLLSALIVTVSPCAFAASAESPDGPVTTLTFLQVNSTTLTAPPTGWTFGSNSPNQLTVGSMAPPVASDTVADALEGSYPVAPLSGADYIVGDYALPSTLTTEDIYIEFWAKMPGTTGGFKFLKVFGERLDNYSNYADMTFLADYTGADPGALIAAYFGDGTAVANDTQNDIAYNGSDPSSIGRSYGEATVLTPQMQDFPSSAWGTAWHHFRIHVKFNDGTTSANEVADGEIYFEVDGKPYLDATGVLNRNPSNGPIQHVQIFGWAQNDGSPFNVYYDDIRITTGGFASDPLPSPPSGLQVH